MSATCRVDHPILIALTTALTRILPGSMSATGQKQLAANTSN